LKKAPPKSIIQWLAKFPVQSVLDGENVSINTEVPVETVAVLLSELRHSHEGSDPFIVFFLFFFLCVLDLSRHGIDQKDVYNIIQFTYFLRLCGMGNEATNRTQNVKLLELQSFFLEIYIQVLSVQTIQERMETLKLLSKFKCYFIKQVSTSSLAPFFFSNVPSFLTLPLSPFF
jgi:hypothetical protein